MDIHVGTLTSQTWWEMHGTWGDHVVLRGAANCFETCIHVISSLPHHHDVMLFPEYDVTGTNQLVLGHVNELHYVSLIPHEGY